MQKNDQSASGLIKEITADLLAKLLIDAEVKTIGTEDGAFNVEINTEAVGLLIGRRGETLNSLQLVLRLLVYKKTGQWQKILVDAGGWREKRSAELHEMALSAAKQAVETGESIVLPPLSSFERRVIHMALADDPSVYSESEGDGKDRRLVVRLKT